MEFGDWFKILDFAWTAVLLAVGYVYRQVMARHREIDERIGGVSDATERALGEFREAYERQKGEHARSVGQVKDRLAQVEAQMEHLPDKDSVHNISLAVAELAGDVKGVTEALKSVGRTTQRLEQYLMEKHKP